MKKEDKEDALVLERHEEQKNFSNKLYGMNNGEKMIHLGITYLRVPGGWVVCLENSCSFVPFDNEFKKVLQ